MPDLAGMLLRRSVGSLDSGRACCSRCRPDAAGGRAAARDGHRPDDVRPLRDASCPRASASLGAHRARARRRPAPHGRAPRRLSRAHRMPRAMRQVTVDTVISAPREADLRLRRRPLAAARLLRPLPQGLPAGARQSGRARARPRASCSTARCSTSGPSSRSSRPTGPGGSWRRGGSASAGRSRLVAIYDFIPEGAAPRAWSSPPTASPRPRSTACASAAPTAGSGARRKKALDAAAQDLRGAAATRSWRRAGDRRVRAAKAPRFGAHVPAAKADG